MQYSLLCRMLIYKRVIIADPLKSCDNNKPASLQVFHFKK